MGDIAIFSGSAHPDLAREICKHLEVPLSPSRLTRFANDCLEVQLEANCRERDVFLIQPIVAPVQEHLMELLLMLDAARGASAARITAVIPTTPMPAPTRRTRRASPSAASWWPTCWPPPAPAGADHDPALAPGARLLLHAGGPPARPAGAGSPLRRAGPHQHRRGLSRPGQRQGGRGLRSPAGGRGGRGRQAAVLRRPGGDQRHHRRGHRQGRHRAGRRDRQGHDRHRTDRPPAPRKVRSIRVACTHGLFANDAARRILAEAGVDELVTTNTAPISENDRASGLKVLSVAPALAEAIRRIHNGESVSALFA
uniref:ribose-phosphate diphosphokinase n=1 Tax=Phenylobacterium glaciei TaxID=2803784 RepID=A0A974SA03_9CAUL|nr:ribose-phosphate pyrophosphokinase [Phenylobacterium glaciei]